MLQIKETRGQDEAKEKAPAFWRVAKGKLRAEGGRASSGKNGGREGKGSAKALWWVGAE